MLDAAVAAWLDALPDERALDEPFMALLRASGYTDVHLVHGIAELGRDIIAKRDGRSVIYVARQLGHDARLTLNRCGHVMDELEEAPRIAAEDAIEAARQRVRADAGGVGLPIRDAS